MILDLQHLMKMLITGDLFSSCLYYSSNSGAFKLSVLCKKEKRNKSCENDAIIRTRSENVLEYFISSQPIADF